MLSASREVTEKTDGKILHTTSKTKRNYPAGQPAKQTNEHGSIELLLSEMDMPQRYVNSWYPFPR